MQKFDTSCGLSQKQIGAIKYNVKNEILRQLPVLPEPVETKLFFEGRDSWTYSWNLKNKQFPIDLKNLISLEVVVKLKKEFHKYLESKHYTFLCKVQLTKDVYHPKISIKQEDA